MDVEYFVAARVTRIAVKNVTAFILIEHAVAFSFRMPWILHGVVEKGFFRRRFLRRKRHMIVEVEICATGGNPRETPAHPFFIGSQFLRCTLMPLKPSALSEQCGHPALSFGPNMK